MWGLIGGCPHKTDETFVNQEACVVGGKKIRKPNLSYFCLF